MAGVHQQNESKPRQVLEAGADAVATEALSSAFEFAFKALGEALSCAGELAASCGAVAVDVVCQAAGSALDGL